MEKQISSKCIYDGKVIHVVKDEVQLDDKTIAYREVVKHYGGVCIALEDDGYFHMVRQYRYAQAKQMLEFPAGKIELNENPDDAIKREAIEETGYSIKEIKKLGYIIPTCGYSSEKIYLYYGKVDKYLGQNLDIDERIDTEKYSILEIKEMIKKGIIDDGKTIALMYKIELEGLMSTTHKLNDL